MKTSIPPATTRSPRPNGIAIHHQNGLSRSQKRSATARKGEAAKRLAVRKTRNITRKTVGCASSHAIWKARIEATKGAEARSRLRVAENARGASWHPVGPVKYCRRHFSETGWGRCGTG